MGNRIIVIGASLGGVEALRQLTAALPADLGAPVLIVLHVGARPSRLPQVLARVSALPVQHALDGEALEPGRVYIAPPDHHLLVDRGVARLSRGPKESRTRPAADPLFRSAALAYGPDAIAVVLTGTGDDGTAGLLAIKDRGGTTIVQDPATALARGMPGSALLHADVDHCGGIPRIAELLTALAGDDPAGTRVTRSLLSSAEVVPAADWALLVACTRETRHTCLECGLPLREMGDPRFARFRCEMGHALSAASLDAAAVPPPETAAAKCAVGLPGRGV